MDLCRLHFSHSQRERKDAPFSYIKISNDKLVISCRALETRLLSHTGGLLELIPLPSQAHKERLYDKQKDNDPILLTRFKVNSILQRLK